MGGRRARGAEGVCVCALRRGFGTVRVLLWGVFTSCWAPKNASRASAVAPCRGGDSGIPEEGYGSRRCQRVPEQGSKVALEYLPPSGLFPLPRSITFARASGTYFRSFGSRASGTRLRQCLSPGQRALSGAERSARGAVLSAGLASDAQVVIVTQRVSRSRVTRVFQALPLCK